MTINREQIDDRIAEINALMHAHAGAVELLEISDDGCVSVRFVGKCTGCELKPLTLAGTVRPGLLGVAGVSRVIAAGTRISDEAARRLDETLGSARTSSRVLGLLSRRRAHLQELRHD